MSYVLSVIRPPVEPAAFGQADVSDPVALVQHAADIAGDSLIGEGVGTLEARDFGNALAHELVGTERTHTGTGVTFRIDPADNPPNVCPCCGRLSRPGEHAFAGLEDALCLGCYTYSGVTQCLPTNSAHTEEPT